MNIETHVADKLLTYRYPRTLAEARLRMPCNRDEAIAIFHYRAKRPFRTAMMVAFVASAVLYIAI